MCTLTLTRVCVRTQKHTQHTDTPVVYMHFLNRTWGVTVIRTLINYIVVLQGKWLV